MRKIWVRFLILIGVIMMAWCGTETIHLWQNGYLFMSREEITEQMTDAYCYQVGLDLCAMYNGFNPDGFYYSQGNPYEYAQMRRVDYSVYSKNGSRIGGNVYLDYNDLGRVRKYVFTNADFGIDSNGKDYGKYIYITIREEDMEGDLLAFLDRPLWLAAESPARMMAGIGVGFLLVLVGIISLKLQKPQEMEPAGRIGTFFLRIPFEVWFVTVIVLADALNANWTYIAGPSAAIWVGTYLDPGRSRIPLWAATAAVVVLVGEAYFRGQKEGYRRTILYRAAVMIRDIIRNLPLVLKYILIAIPVCAAQGVAIWFLATTVHSRISLLILFLAEKIILNILLLYDLVVFERFEKAVSELASGNLNYQMQTNYLPGLFRRFSRELNAVADSVSKAVEEQMRSERMKTELITNVTHDIKTPLTSIINFADLIGKENSENPRIVEYSDHLYKQSTRLKHLIENLIEVSKATTGNLEVYPEICELRVLMGQCVGEYESRLQQKNIELCLRQTEAPVYIMADPKLLVRILENLMSNICKYALENTRVFLITEQINDKARITLMNTSKYPLDMTPESLMERFVRGDLSRHTDGNGLGLSIVKSLMDLQNGEIRLDLEGDLFKVFLEFKVVGPEKIPVLEGTGTEPLIEDRKPEG